MFLNYVLLQLSERHGFPCPSKDFADQPVCRLFLLMEQLNSALLTRPGVLGYLIQSKGEQTIYILLHSHCLVSVVCWSQLARTYVYS